MIRTLMAFSPPVRSATRQVERRTSLFTACFWADLVRLIKGSKPTETVKALQSLTRQKHCFLHLHLP